MECGLCIVVRIPVFTHNLERIHIVPPIEVAELLLQQCQGDVKKFKLLFSQKVFWCIRWQLNAPLSDEEIDAYNNPNTEHT